MAEDDNRPAVSRRARLYNLSSLAFAFPVSIAVGAYMGYYLDGKLNSFPWLTILLLFAGVGAGFLNFYRAIKAFDRPD